MKDLSSRRLFWPNGEWNRDRHDQTRFKQKASWPWPWHYTWLPKGRKNPRVHQLMNREMKCDSHTHTKEYYSDVKKEWRWGTCCNVDESQNRYAPWKAPDTKGYRRWWFHLQEIFSRGKSMETVARTRGEGGLQNISIASMSFPHLTSVVIENSGTRNGYGCTTFCIVIQLNSTLPHLRDQFSLGLHQRCFRHTDSQSPRSGLATHWGQKWGHRADLLFPCLTSPPRVDIHPGHIESALSITASEWTECLGVYRTCSLLSQHIFSTQQSLKETLLTASYRSANWVQRG